MKADINRHTISLVTVIALFLICITGFLTYFQAFFFESLFITSFHIKAFLAFFIGISLFTFSDITQKNNQKPILYFALFLVINLISILFNSRQNTVLDQNNLLAFFYNYSLMIVVFPFFIFLNSPPQKRYTKKLYILFILFLAAFALCSNTYGVYSSIDGFNLLKPPVRNFLYDGNYIKFDHLHGIRRLGGFFKSPVECGIINSFLSSLLIALALTNKNRKIQIAYLMFSILFLIFSILTLSRTIILMGAIQIGFVLLVYLKSKITNFKPNFKIISLSVMTFALSLLTLFLVLKNKLTTILSPANLVNRFSIWQNALDQISANWHSFFWGLGKVQNSTFGPNHTISIDNMYLGILLTGGIFSMLLFILIIYYIITNSIQYMNKAPKMKIVSSAFMGFFISFLIGGLTENFMHSLFLPILALVAMKVLIDDSLSAETA